MVQGPPGGAGRANGDRSVPRGRKGASAPADAGEPNGDPGQRATMPLRPQRMAELVAERLRNRILRGELRDGDLLPKEDELREEFPVSKPSLREALRILETEGLVSVRRGNVGGAVVHRPTAANAGYTLGLVLTAERVTLGDLGEALREVEPLCAALCAMRRDRRKAVVPELRRIHKGSLASIGNLVAVTAYSRQFHEALVAFSGNQTLKVVAGALEALWSAHETEWALRKAEERAFPLEVRRAAVDVHEQIIDLIHAGDADGVRTVAREHLAHVQLYPAPGDGEVIDMSALHLLGRV